MKKKQPTERTKVKVWLEFQIDVEVSDADDTAEVAQQVMLEFREGIRQRWISISEAITKTEVV